MERWLAEKLSTKGVAYPENPKEIVLLEDSLRNLEPAYRCGWTTIFVNPTPDAPDWVDFHIPHLLNLCDIKPDSAL
jgi:putative hydrolase of the HAD superfamily